MFFERKWWKEAIGYQIYLKSFKDSNNDGIGDLNGIREKLDYLKDLGVNLLWITPYYQSPMDDNGYDVSDFYNIDPSFGTLEDFKMLIKEAHLKGIKIIGDFVMNHTSDEHEWFIESRNSTNNKYRDYYIWAKGKVVNGVEVEPTNWSSFFGGSCWQKDELTNEYYMKIFSKKMPDLNYQNKDVRLEMQKVAKFWLDLGIDGFRIDAVAHIGRSEVLEDSKMEGSEKYKPDWRKFSNLPILFDYLNEFKVNVFDKYDMVSIGEVGGGATPDEALEYAGLNNGPVSMVFNFDHCWSNNVWGIKHKDEKIKTDLINLKRVFLKWYEGQYKKAWAPIYWLNHDQPRVMSQYGNKNKRFLSGSMLATALYLMWGTPFIYQGEEIGMTNFPFKDITDFNDVSVKNTYLEEVIKNGANEEDFIFKTGLNSRDNPRTVISWDSSEFGGFSNVKPWFHVHPDFKEVNIKDDLTNKDSLLNYYKKVLKLRKEEKYLNTFVYGTYEQLLKEDENIYAYLRKRDKKILVVTNFFDKEVNIKLPNFKIKEILLSNYQLTELRLTEINLKPYQSFVVEVV